MRKLIIICIWLIILACSLSALAATNETLSQLIVKGEGDILASPDMVTIELGAETRNASSDIAAAQNAEIMNRTVKALIAAGVKSESIQNGQYSLELPSEELLIKALANDEKPPEYVAKNTVIIKTNDTESVGEIIKAAVSAGSNKIEGIRFYLNDSGLEESKAMAKAISNARAKAEMMAESAGVKLGRILDVSEGYSSSYGVQAAAPSAGESIQIKPTMIDVSADVTITYEIQPPE